MNARRRRHSLALALAVVGTAVFAVPAPAAERLDASLARAEAPVGELAAAGRIAVPGGGVIRRFEQRVAGLEVFDAEAVVAIPDRARPILVTDTTDANLRAPAGEPGIGSAAATRAAIAAVGADALRAPVRARLGVDAESGLLAWQVSVPAARPLGDFSVTLDARTAGVIRSRDLLHQATGAAAVFVPNPVVTQGSREGLIDAKDRDSAALTALRIPVTLERITSPNGCLVGTYVEARLGKRAKPVCRPSLDFTDLTRSDERFEAVMAYFHIDRTRAYVDSLGLSRRLRLKPQRVRANGIRVDNSYFSSLTHSMTLGTGGVDDAEDADVIVHEYGHSLQDQAVHGFGRSFGAGSIGEGFGDYLAAAMSALTTGGDAEADACIFDWDGISYTKSGCGRRADRTLTLKQAHRKCRRDIHCTGEVWSSALLALRGVLGNDPAGLSVMDRVVLESHFMLAKRSGFVDAARALIAADRLLYAGAHAAAIEAEMIKRRLCKRSGC